MVMGAHFVQTRYVVEAIFLECEREFSESLAAHAKTKTPEPRGGRRSIIKTLFVVVVVLAPQDDDDIVSLPLPRFLKKLQFTHASIPSSSNVFSTSFALPSS